MYSTDAERLRVVTAERLADLLNQEGICYAVVNGLYGYPERVGRDLDILVDKRDVYRAIWLVKRVKDELGWQFLFGRWSYHGVWQLFLVSPSNDGSVWLEIDLMCDDKNLLVGITPFSSIQNIISASLTRRGPFHVSPKGEYLKAYFRPIFYGDIQRFREKYALRPPEREEEKQELKRLLGERLLKEYLEKIESSLEELKDWSSQLKWRLNLRYAIRHPVSAFRNLVWTRFLRPLYLWWFNAGLVVAVVGPDGVGKSSAIREAVRHLDGLFDIRVRHWRPGLLPAPARLVGKKSKDSSLPNRKRPFFVEHWIRIIYYWLDYVFGYFIKDRFLPKSVIQLVIYDRHAIDTAVDPLRYRLRSSYGTSLLYRFTPRPYIILITDKPERIAARKGELSLPEIQQQFVTWKKLTKKGFVNSVIQAGSSAEETGRKLANEILKVVAKKFDVRKTKIYKRALQYFGFKTVWVNGVCRLAWPSRWDALCAPIAKELYTPYKRIIRILYSLWWKCPISTRKLLVVYKEKVPRLDKDYENIQELISKIMGEQNLIPVFYFPPQIERMKTSIFLLRKDGEAVAFVKMGWEEARREIQNEIDAIRFLNSIDIKSFDVPQLLSEGWYANVRYAVYSPVFGNIGAGYRWNKIYQNLWEELTSKTKHELSLEEIINKLYSDLPNASLWEPILDKLISLMKGKTTCSSVHGDFAPWNIRVQNGKIILLDWEEFATSAPYLTDPAHFVISVTWLGQKRGPSYIARNLRLWVSNYDIGNVIVAIVYLASRRKFSERLLFDICIQLLKAYC